MIAAEFVPRVRGMGKRASDDDIIVNVCWKLGDLIVDRPMGLGDSDAEKKQRL